jgi:DNA-binding transcriptional regulator of glucitol operon
MSRIWFSRRAILMHLTLIVVVPTFIGLFWWQVQRVRQGNTLSWAYVFEWPFFAGYAVYMWWKLVHDQPVPTDQAVPTHQPVPADQVEPTDQAEPEADRDDREMAAYNRYLAELDTSGRRKHW